MSKLVALPVAFALALTIAGCQAKPKMIAVAPPVPTEAAYVQIKQDFAASSPDAKVGYVEEALPDEPWVAITHVEAADFPMGAPVNLLDADKNILAQGHVEKLVDGKAYVKYIKQGARMPAAGDVAVRF